MTTGNTYITVNIGSSMSLRLEVQVGDYLLWIRSDLMSASPRPHPLDFWEVHDGDKVLVTTNSDDLPPWFCLHPNEVQGSTSFKMMHDLENGYEPPPSPLQGPNIWRVLAGDRIAWIGTGPRGRLNSVNGILAFFTFTECALALGEPGDETLRGHLGFGAPQAELSPFDSSRIGFALAVAQKLGSPRVRALEWRFG